MAAMPTRCSVPISESCSGAQRGSAGLARFASAKQAWWLDIYNVKTELLLLVSAVLICTLRAALDGLGKWGDLQWDAL